MAEPGGSVGAIAVVLVLVVVGCASSDTPVVQSHIFSLLPVYPSFTDSSNELCRNDSRLFREELMQFKLWAVSMLDASSKLPDGVIAGNTFQMGHFDECLGVKVGLENNRRLQGQYCMAHIEYSPSNMTVETWPHHSLSELFNISAWHYIKSFSLDRTKIRRDEIYWAVCVPDSCSQDEVEDALRDAIQQQTTPLGIDVSVSIRKHMCQVQDVKTEHSWFGPPEIAVVSIMLTFIVLVLISSSLQAFSIIEKNHKSGIGKFLNCFSCQNNFNALRRVDKSRDIMVVHTFRFISMLVVLLGHRFIADGPAPVFNADYIETLVSTNYVIHFLVGPILVVDVFFLLSGFLTGNQIFNELDNGSFQLIPFYVHRYLRLTPVYMLVVAFFALFIIHLGSGPLWMARVTVEQERCLANWWTNMLYLNNYVNPKQLCMFQSWHLTCDFHFLLVAPALVYFLWKRPKSAIAFILLMVGVCAATLFAITFTNNLDPSLLSYKSVVADLCADPTFIMTYIPTHTRYMPYLFGLLASYAYYKRKSYGVVSEQTIYFGAVVVAILLHIPIFTSILFYSEDMTYDVLSSSLFASLHRIPWSIGLSIMIVMTATKNAYFFQKMLEWRALAPLSRLTYCVFLIHSAVQLFTAATLRSPPQMSYFHFMKSFMGDVLTIYIVAFVFHMLFEAPILRLDRAYLSKRTKTTRKETNGEINRGFALDAPTIFSNAEEQFSVTAHEKYSDRFNHYTKKTPKDESSHVL